MTNPSDLVLPEYEARIEVAKARADAAEIHRLQSEYHAAREDAAEDRDAFAADLVAAQTKQKEGKVKAA